jgi:hypothetical protein
LQALRDYFQVARHPGTTLKKWNHAFALCCRATKPGDDKTW